MRFKDYDRTQQRYVGASKLSATRRRGATARP